MTGYNDVSLDMALLAKAAAVENAMDAINDGFPLDEDMRNDLKQVGIDPDEFYAEHGDKL